MSAILTALFIWFAIAWISLQFREYEVTTFFDRFVAFPLMLGAICVWTVMFFGVILWKYVRGEELEFEWKGKHE